MKKLFLATFLILATTVITNAQQSYTTGIGLRGGLASGVTIKHFVGDNAALEGILSTRWSGVIITGLYEIQKTAFDTPGLYWFYGVGGHIGFWDNYAGHRWFDNNGAGSTVIGVDGILGMEYAFAEIPFSISLDWKPAFNVIGNTGFWGDSGALSVRYIF
ncbi:MAG: hypothetical protein ACOC11_02475 [Prolixibacteraceae bacterium]